MKYHFDFVIHKTHYHFPFSWRVLIVYLTNDERNENKSCSIWSLYLIITEGWGQLVTGRPFSVPWRQSRPISVWARLKLKVNGKTSRNPTFFINQMSAWLNSQQILDITWDTTHVFFFKYKKRKDLKLFSSQAQAVRVMMRTVRVSECELRSPDDGTPAPGLTWREQRGERESSPVCSRTSVYEANCLFYSFTPFTT